VNAVAVGYGFALPYESAVVAQRLYRARIQENPPRKRFKWAI
jgi:hypothetical protein